MGQEFEREHRGISSSLGHDIRNPPRKTKPRGDSVTWVWHHLKVHSLACLTVNADVCRDFGMIEDQYIYTWPHHVTAWASSQHSAWLPRPSAPQQPGRSYVALYGQVLEVAFTMIKKACPNSRGRNLSPPIRGESVRVILRVVRQILLQPVLENTTEHSTEMINHLVHFVFSNIFPGLYYFMIDIILKYLNWLSDWVIKIWWERYIIWCICHSPSPWPTLGEAMP